MRTFQDFFCHIFSLPNLLFFNKIKSRFDRFIFYFKMVDECDDDDEKALLSILAELDQVPCPSGGKTVPLPAGEETPEPISETEGIPFWAKCLAGATGIGKGSTPR